MIEDQIKSALILIIDDQVANICLMQNILNRVGFTNVHSLTDSRMAFRTVTSLQPDLIVLDLNMPHVSGYEVLQQLDIVIGRDAYLPTLVITADGTTAAKRKALAAGATELLHKPFDAAEVIVRIRNLLKTRFLHLEVQGQNARLEEKVAERTRELSEAIAELKTTQQQVLAQERLRAFSEMAGGVVHDFNNALMAVIGYSDLLLSDESMLDDHATVIEYLRTMNLAGRDAAHVVSRLRDFYRPREMADLIGPVDLNALLEEVVALTQPKWKDQAQASGRTIKVEMDFEKLNFVNGNEAEIRELATNLVFNAVDAMPNGGAITLRTARIADGAAFEVIDNGTGMTEAVRNRCLEPFFSTKGDKGTGLGLSMVFGVVKRHNGNLEIESELGVGTTFRIQLPRGEAEAEALKDECGAFGRSLNVLVVDDEPVTRHVVAKYLEMDGHTVVTATNGKEGISKFAAGKFDLLLTDHAMPEMNGVELAAAVKAAQQNMPVILLTGFDATATHREEHPPEVDCILHKPIPQSTLRRAIQDALLTTAG
jgi:signal transduction histidine kinase